MVLDYLAEHFRIGANVAPVARHVRRDKAHRETLPSVVEIRDPRIVFRSSDLLSHREPRQKYCLWAFYFPNSIGTIGHMATITDTQRDILSDPSTYTVSLLTAAEILGIARTSAYALARRGELTAGVPILRVGGRYTVSTAHLRRVLGIE